MVERASCSRFPSSRRASGSRAPRPREAWASGDFLPATEAATWRMASVESAPATAARACSTSCVDDRGASVMRAPAPVPPPV